MIVTSTHFDAGHEEECKLVSDYEDALEDAFDAGQAAFAAGKGRAPALNPSFVLGACEHPDDTADLLGEYLRGWDRANLAAPLG